MESHCLSVGEEKIERSEMKGIERSCTDLCAMQWSVCPYLLRKVKGVQHFSPLMMIDRHLRCAKKTNDIADVEKNDGMK